MAINNPYVTGPLLTQPLQQEAERMRSSLDWLLRGLETGDLGAPNLLAIGEVLPLIGDVYSFLGQEAASPLMQRYLYPAATGVWGRDLQHEAMRVLSGLATTERGMDPYLTAWLTSTPATIQGYGVRGDILSRLAQTFGQDPQFQTIYRRFLETAAPGGNVAGMPVPVWSAAAAPYFAMVEALGGPEFYQQAGLPTPMFPQTAANMPRQAQDVVTAIHRAQAAARGFPFLGPEGLMPQTPLQQYIQSIRDAARGLEAGVVQRAPQVPEGFRAFAPQQPAAPQQAEGRRGLRDYFSGVISNIRQRMESLGAPPGLDVEAIMRDYPTPSDFLNALMTWQPETPEDGLMKSQAQAWAMRHLVNNNRWRR